MALRQTSDSFLALLRSGWVNFPALFAIRVYGFFMPFFQHYFVFLPWKPTLSFPLR